MNKYRKHIDVSYMIQLSMIILNAKFQISRLLSLYEIFDRKLKSLPIWVSDKNATRKSNVDD